MIYSFGQKHPAHWLRFYLQQDATKGDGGRSFTASCSTCANALVCNNTLFHNPDERRSRALPWWRVFKRVNCGAGSTCSFRQWRLEENGLRRGNNTEKVEAFGRNARKDHVSEVDG